MSGGACPWLAVIACQVGQAEPVDTDTQLQLARAILRQRPCTNCKRGAKAMLWIAEESQEGAVFLHDRHEIVRGGANGRIKQTMEILR